MPCGAERGFKHQKGFFKKDLSIQDVEGLAQKQVLLHFSCVTLDVFYSIALSLSFPNYKDNGASHFQPAFFWVQFLRIQEEGKGSGAQSERI